MDDLHNCACIIEECILWAYKNIGEAKTIETVLRDSRTHRAEKMRGSTVAISHTT